MPAPHRVGMGMFRPYLNRTVDDPLPSGIRLLLGAVEAQGLDANDYWVALGGKPRPEAPAESLELPEWDDGWGSEPVVDMNAFNPDARDPE
jgi:hypothetical protein